MLEVRDVHVDYDGAVALAGVDLDVRAGEIVALVGANGAGKSSLLAAVAGAHRPIRGTVHFEGAPIERLPAHRIAGLGVRLVPEGRRLFPHLSVEQNLMLGAFGRRDRAARTADANFVLSLFPVLGERLGQTAGRLSGGEQQMLALGRALMGEPRLLMLDEPSLGVAPRLANRIFEVLAELRERGTTLLVVEQDVRRTLQLADRAYVMQNGRIVSSGPAAELEGSEEIRRAYLGV